MWTNPDPEYQTYEEIDLAPYLREGANSIAALVYNPGRGLHHRMDARGGFFLQADIRMPSGESYKLLTDSTWRVAKARAWDPETDRRQRAFCIGYREQYDARLAIEGWQDTGFDDSDWEMATEIGIPPLEPWNHIVVVHRERLRYENHQPVASWEVDGWRVFDFGKIISAFPQFTLHAEQAGVEMLFGSGERLDDKRLPVMTHEINFTDTYLTREGRQSWQPVTWRAFRYLAFETKPGVRIEEVRAKFRSFPVRPEGEFACSDPLLNKIWEVGRWSLQINAHDTWMDTPWREQTQYIAGDTRYNMRYSAYAFAPNIKLLLDYNILSGAFSQRHSEAGAIRSRYPTGAFLGPKSSTYIPDYQLEWVLMLKEHAMYYDDRDLIAQVYPVLKRLLAYFEGYRSAERGLIGQVPGWVVLDHPDTYPMDVDGENTAVNCLYHGALNAAAWLARELLDDEPQAAEWEDRAKEVKAAIQKHLWSEKDRAFRDGFTCDRITQQTQVYALLYGLVPEGHEKEVADFMVKQGRSCEQSFSYWLLHAGFDAGHGPWALDYIRKYWGDQMADKKFSGSWYENWDPALNMTLSHAWTSGPTALLPEKVLGIEPVAPGWSQFAIRPRLHGLEWASAVVPSPTGLIRVKATRNGMGMKMDVVIPEKTSAVVSIPVPSLEAAKVSVDGQTIWENGESRNLPTGIRFQSAFEESIICEFPPGIYQITSGDP